MPLLVSAFGLERFGVLALAWALLGYLGLLDLGVGRALTREIAVRLAEGREREQRGLIWSSVAVNGVAGVVAAVLVLALGSWLVAGLDLTPELRAESRDSIAILSVSMPFVLGTASLRGVLEAHQRFATANAIRVPLAIATFLGPLLATVFSSALPPAMAAITLARVVGWLVHWEAVRRLVPGLGRGRPSAAVVRALLRSGVWLNVSGVVSPLLVTIDRFYLATFASVVAVAHFAVPYEVVTRLWVFPSAVVGVLFPAFAFAYATDRARLVLWSARALKYIYLGMLPPVLVFTLFAPELMRVWLGDALATEIVRILQWLSIGLFVNSLAFLPYTVIQGVGRADLTGKLHLAELLPYTVALALLVALYGAEGAAIAWAGRLIVDAAVLFALSVRLVPDLASATKRTALAVLPAVAVFAGGLTLEAGAARAAVGVLAAGALLVAAPRVLDRAEFAFLSKRRSGPRAEAL